MKSRMLGLKINKSKVELFLLLLPLFRPTCVTMYSTILTIYNIITVFVFLYLFLEYVKKMRFDKFFCIIFCLEVWIFIVTFFTYGARGTALYRLETIIIMALLVKRYYKKRVLFVNTLMLHFECCIYVNFFMMLSCPRGFFDYNSEVYSAVGIETMYWFLGVSNSFLIWFVPGLFIAWLYRDLNKQNVRCYILTFIVFLSLLIKNSTTCLIGCCIFIFLLFVPKLIPFVKKFVTPKFLMLVVIMIFWGIVVIQKSDFLEPIIKGLLGKDMTFSNRLIIWKNAIMSFKNKPIIGHGIMSMDNVVCILGRFSTFIWAGATHCHDEILQIIFEGGLIALFLYVIIWVFSMKRIVRNWNVKSTKIIFYGCLVVFIIGITEVTEYALLYLPIFMGYWFTNRSFDDK